MRAYFGDLAPHPYVRALEVVTPARLCRVLCIPRYPARIQ
jgi:hypothetical protein